MADRNTNMEALAVSAGDLPKVSVSAGKLWALTEGLLTLMEVVSSQNQRDADAFVNHIKELNTQATDALKTSRTSPAFAVLPPPDRPSPDAEEEAARDLQLKIANERDTQLKDALFSLRALIRFGDTNTLDEIDDTVNELCRKMWPEEFVD